MEAINKRQGVCECGECVSLCVGVCWNESYVKCHTECHVEGWGWLGWSELCCVKLTNVALACEEVLVNVAGLG